MPWHIESQPHDVGEPINTWQERPEVVAVQRRVVRVLIIAQIVGGVGIGAGETLGALLAQAVTSSEALAGLARTATTLGAAAVALPLALMARFCGRAVSLALGWAVAAVGGGLCVLSAVIINVPVLVIGLLLFGCASAINLQSRYAAIDLALPVSRGRTLSLVVWSTTVGSVAGPNLVGPGEQIAAWLGLPPLSGGFVVAGAVLVAPAAAMALFLRPDPLLIAQRYTALAPRFTTTAPRRNADPSGLPAAIRAIVSYPATRFAFIAIALAHTTMAAVMTMTPVHMMDHGSTLTLVGIVISLHVVGMYAFSPIVGILSDRIGRAPVVAIGQLTFIAAATIGALAGHSTIAITACLLLVGLGWSFTLISASTLLAESVPKTLRPTVQGASDMTMNLAAAIAAGVSGFVQQRYGFAGLNITAALLTIPTLLLLHTVRGTPPASARITASAP